MKNIKNLHLVLSTLCIVPVALVYGVSPGNILPQLFDFTITGTDLSNIFRAQMGLYLGMAILWIMGCLKPRLWYTATVVNIVFMTGLALGRLISLVLDGAATIYLFSGMFVELTLALFATRNLRKFHK
jgi:hypothetical protein